MNTLNHHTTTSLLSLTNWQDLFEALPECYLVLAPEAPTFTILAASRAYMKVTQTTKEILGQPLFDVFPDNPADPDASGVKNLTASLEHVIATKKNHEMAIQRYDTRHPENNSFNIRYWKPLNVPVLNPDGSIAVIIHSVKEVTDVVLLRKDLKEQDHLAQEQIRNAILTTQEMERAEISQELHDNINQILNTARLYVENAMSAPSSEQGFLKLGHELIEKAIAEVKALSHALLHLSKEEKALTTELEEILGQVTALKQFNLTKNIALPDQALIESKVKTTIIRILQEQLSNVVKHADAKNVSISVNFKNNNLELVIKDDGKGFDPTKVKQGLGFQNIKSRVAMMDGQVRINSFPGDGCEIQVFLPAKMA